MSATDFAAALLLAVYAATVTLLSLCGLHRWHLLHLARRHRDDDDTTVVTLGQLPVVTVQLPVFNERYVISRLLRAVSRLDYPGHLLEVQVLDDSTDDTSRRVARLAAVLRRRGLDIKHLRRRHRQGFKAGALAAGTREARGSVMAIFDADFVPPPGFLRTALPHFSHAAVGMVQARWRHLNRESSLLTRLQAILLDGHFFIEHLARSRSGRFFNFNGTAGLWRRACIEDAGGWQDTTLTEDLDLSYRAQLRGWRFVYLPKLTAAAELPRAMSAFKSQQHRWAKGSVETACKLLGPILTSRLPWRVRLEACMHLGANCSYLLMILLVILIWPSLLLRRGLDTAILTYLDLPAFVLATLSVAGFYWHSQKQAGRGPLARLAALPAVMGLGAGLALNNGLAALQALAGQRTPFVRTPKRGAHHTAALAPGYRSAPGWLPVAESLLAVYLILALGHVLALGLWAWAPFLLIFAWGFTFVAVAGWKEWLTAARQRQQPTV